MVPVITVDVSSKLWQCTLQVYSFNLFLYLNIPRKRNYYYYYFYFFFSNFFKSIFGFLDFRNIFVHGFVLDREGRKMSKSLGNVIDPHLILDGKEKKQPAIGIDALR